MSATTEVAKAAPVPERVGSYRVVAHFDFLGGSGERVLLLARSGDLGLEYATGVVSVFEHAPREWSWGRYFDSVSTRDNLHRAWASFQERVTTRINAAD
ncbi:hypothetical protein ALI22I_33795 [Saccharothrix sp. ALI-22-I]|uniref:hypothetical protein n=1 Tax=Saccharothrix sp. ALI-22-I TaxID=1933778 RepID=UPI00097CA238|nr:hypothetical protein [Saccharothrix sp. ALI-22-I]ONI83474.1 hypothetical protein ALI22I_33795 [Saccharothrix sp. ALI-22-I]